jgi:hypothetical protein
MQSDQIPFVLHFIRPITLEGMDPFTEAGARFDEGRSLWIDSEGRPLYAGGRASKPYTAVYTQSHYIKGGYTPSGKYRPGKTVPGKTDKRAGK